METIELIHWIVSGIMILNLVGLYLALKINKKMDQINARLNNQGLVLSWDQMCEDAARYWGIGRKKQKKNRNLPYSNEGLTNADFNMRAQFYDESKGKGEENK